MLFRSATLEIDKFSFSSSGYLDVSVPRVPHVQLCIHCTLTEVFSAGFPHSDISGSMDICSSPKLFAAYHVFHRLLVPRHPPCALLRLTNFLCHVASRQLVWVFIKFITFKSKLSKITTSCDYLSVISSDVFLLNI